MRNKEVHSYRRILVGATCFADTESALDLALNIAKNTTARLEGLLLKDEATLSLASMHSTRVAATSPGRFQAITELSMKKAFERDAEFFRRKLEQTATLATVEWGFEQKSGSVESILELLRGKDEIVLLGFQRLTAASPRPSIALVVERGNENKGIRELADLLAVKLGLRIENQKVDAKSQSLDTQCSQLLETLNKQSYSAVIIHVSLAKALGVQRLLYAARCPILILT